MMDKKTDIGMVESEKRKPQLEIEKKKESRPPATECCLSDWMEHFDFAASPKKPKPLSEMTEEELFGFISELIRHEIKCNREKTHHRQTWFRRNKIDLDGEVPEKSSKVHNCHLCYLPTEQSLRIDLCCDCFEILNG